jgi:hypothetical protein
MKGMLVFDQQTLAIVQVARGRTTSASVDEIVSAARRAREESDKRKQVVQWLTVIDDAAEPPNAVDRRRIMEAVNDVPRLHSATVVTSAFHRAVLTALSWLRRPAPGQRFETFAAVPDAIRWLEGLDARRADWKRLLGDARARSAAAD